MWLPTQNEMIEGDLPDAIQRAEDRASELAQDGSLAAATPIGEVGDPATAIIRAAHEHAVDIVVIGSHQHSWLGRLFSSSVERSLLREADFAVMIVQHG
ncbi:MAG: Universal stress protein family [Ilumatobacteraceae bacterium]|nr:Universal stress protein family [Ilumatobacteraceae bacterium]